MLELKNLNLEISHFQQSKKILSNIDLNIGAGEIHFLIGANGSGKSSLLKCIAGIHSPTYDFFKTSHSLSYLPAESQLQDHLYLNEVLEIYNIDRKHFMSSEVVHKLGVDVFFHAKSCLQFYQLSSGEKQRFMICSQILSDKKLLVWDEPLNYLDWHYSNALVDILCQHLDQSKKSLLIACHDLNWCLQFDQNLGQRSQAYCLDQGRMIAKNDIKNLLLDPNTQKAFNFVSKITDNPIDNSNLLVVAAYDKQRQQQTQS